jgi:hypothetical protein
MIRDFKRVARSGRTAADAIGALALLVALVAGLHLPVFG